MVDKLNGSRSGPVNYVKRLTSKVSQALRRPLASLDIIQGRPKGDSSPGGAAITVSPEQAALRAPSKAVLALAKKTARQINPGVVAKGWVVAHGGDSKQKLYAERFWQTALQTSALLEKDTPPHLEPLLRAMGRERKKIARDLTPDNYWDFGVYRERPQLRRTAIAQRYLLPCVHTFLAELEARVFPADGKHLRLVPTRSTRSSVWQVVASLPNGKEVKLTALVKINDDSPWWWEHGYLDADTLAHMDGLLATACAPVPGLSPADKKEQILPKIALLQWWMAHTMPFERGSAAVADMLTAALMHRHGMTFPGWKRNVSGDVVALCTPDPEVFVRGFADLLRG